MALKDKKNNSSQFLNENIPFSQVLLVTNKDEKEVVSRQEALNRAKSFGLDLFCVAPTKNPPVCKLIDYQKYIFELSKKKKEKIKNDYKEESFSLNIGKNDRKHKLEKIQEWIEKGMMVKVNIIKIGREKSRLESAHKKCQEIITELKNQSSKIELKDDIRQNFGTLCFFLYKKKQ